MMYTAFLIAASAAIASAQVTYNSTTNTFICPASNPNGAYCASSSLSSNIIIRCNNGVGQPGNCNDNLAGYPPFGVNYAPCWQSTNTSGDAACSKNCIVEGSSGNYNGTFTLPGCTPASSTISTAATTTDIATSTVTTTCTTNSTTVVQTYTTTYCPDTTFSVSVLPTGGSSIVISNGTTVTNGTVVINGTVTVACPTCLATATPVGPTTSIAAPGSSASGSGSGLAQSSGAFKTNTAGGLAALGLIIAYLL